MNLKESFRYQKFLDGLMRNAVANLQNPCHCLETTKVHYRHAVNPDAVDETEIVDDGEFVHNDVMLAYKAFLGEAELTEAQMAVVDTDRSGTIEEAEYQAIYQIYIGG